MWGPETLCAGIPADVSAEPPGAGRAPRPRLARDPRGRRILPRKKHPAGAEGRLVAPPVFKTGETPHKGRVGSIPMRSRQPLCRKDLRRRRPLPPRAIWTGRFGLVY
jgi:hypothetical protein